MSPKLPLLGATMLRFQRPPDVVFQAILRDSLSYSIDFINDLIGNNEYDASRTREDMKGIYPAMVKVFTPSLARTTLLNLRRRLDRPETYYLNNLRVRFSPSYPVIQLCSMRCLS
jgi:hypothetical protein